METHSEHQRQANLNRLRGMLRGGGRPPRRNKFLPGEGPIDYQRALWKAIDAGMTEPEFEWSRLVKNGWSLESERKYREDARFLGYNLYKLRVPDSHGIMRSVGYDLVDEGERLMAAGKFTGQKMREPGSDDEEIAA